MFVPPNMGNVMGFNPFPFEKQLLQRGRRKFRCEQGEAQVMIDSTLGPSAGCVSEQVEHLLSAMPGCPEE